ncbi:unnamed protein product [Prunus brigantina]
MAPQVTIFFHKIETTRNACTKRVGFKKTFIVGESLIKCAVPKPIQRVKTLVTPKVVKTQLKKALSKNALRNARKRAARALRKKEARKESIEAVLAKLSGTSPMVTEGKNTSSTLAVPTSKRTNATRFVQIMIGSIPVNLYPTDSVLMTSTNETSEEGQKDDSVENTEVQGAEPPSSPKTHAVESTSQEVYPCLSKGKNKAIIMEKKVVNIPHPQRKHVQKVKTTDASRDQNPVSQGVVPKPQEQSRSYMGPLTRSKSRDMMGMTIPELSAPNSTRLDDYLQWNPLYDDPVSQTQENDCVASQGAKLHGGVESMQVMMTGTSNTEDQLPLIQEMMQDLRREMQQKLAEKDAEIALLSARLKEKMVIGEQDTGKTNEFVTPEQQTKEEKAESSTSTISPNDIKALIAEGIREFQMSIAPPVEGYRKPFPSHYDAMPFPKGYQRPIFDKFDGINSSPHEHLAHFYSACGETSQSDALLVRQFVQSLKGSAFTWYTQLPPGSILTWDDMQKAFLAQFVSSKKKVSIMDLAQTAQKPGEGANDFIMRWRSLNLQCPEKITEQSAVQMCYNNLRPDIATFVATAEPQSFDALVSKASNVERQIARQKSTTQKIQVGEKKNDKKSTKGESLATFVKTEKKSDKGQNKDPPKRLTLKERKEVKYSFDDEDVEEIFDQLLASNGITLPESKRPAEANKTNDPRYCRYHRLISHTLKDCYILKDKIQELLNNGGLVIDSSPRHHSATANMIEEKFTPTTAPLDGLELAGINTINGGTIVNTCPKEIPTLHELMAAPSLEVWEDFSTDESAEGWKTFVKRAKHMAKHFPPNHRFTSRPGVKIRGMPTLKNKRKKKKVQKKAQAPQEDEYEQPARVPVTLTEFLPVEFFSSESEVEEEIVQCNMVSVEAHEVDTEVDEINLRSGRSIPSADKAQQNEEANPSKKSKAKEIKVSLSEKTVAGEAPPSSSKAKDHRPDTGKAKESSQSHVLKYDILAHLKRIPAPLSVYDALQMSRELREALVIALMSPDSYKSCFKSANVHTTETSKFCASCMAAITFGEDDFLLGPKSHNRPLYVTGEVGGTTINRILLDCGSAVNLIPLKTLHAIGMSARQLSPSMLTIQGFNQLGQKAMGSIALQMEIGDLYSDALFHVIDADTSYNVLLGRPWLHTYGVVPSTLHQCFKYLVDGEVKSVSADLNPFRGEEVNYSDAKFYGPPGLSFRQPSNVDKENERVTVETRKSQKAEVPKPSRVIRVKLTPRGASSSKGEEVPTSEAPKPKIIIKTSRKEPSEKETGSLKQTMGSLMTTSYTRPLRKINQSIPRGNLVISTTFGKNDGSSKREVVHKKALLPEKTSTPLKIKLKGRKAKKSNDGLTFHNESGVLKVSLRRLHREASEPEVFTTMEQAMFREDEVNTRPLRVSVFKRLGGRQPPRISVFQRLESPSNSQQEKVHNKRKWKVKSQDKFVFKTVKRVKIKDDLAQVNCTSFEETAGQDDNPPDIEEFIDIVQPAPPQMEEGGQATIDDLQEINLGTADSPKPIFVSASLTPQELEEYTQLLQEYRDVFAWGYQDMPGLDPSVAVHKLGIPDETRWVKQAPRRFRPELTIQIEIEIDKLIAAGFIREVQYPTWLSNIVPVLKKTGALRICVDYRDVNEACPKDEFPLPITELLVDATTGFGALSFMDGFSGYNQIKMAPDDQEKTAFRTPKGIYCYTVMPFGLKNAGATYQRAMTVIFNDMLHNTIECYVDDLVVKTRKREHHLSDLKRVFDRLRKHQLKMNPLKCAFGVTSGKFLGFVVRHRGIEIDPSKIKAIREMPPPRNLRELRGLQGRLAYIRRFISNLSGRCQPFSRLMKKDVPFVWDQACQNALESIKQYLLSPPVLMAPIKGRPLILYIAALERSLGALLAQHNEDGKENALYYLSRTLVGAEQNYTPIEKVCLALVFAVQKLRHYILSHRVILISKADPLRYLMSKPVLSGRIAKWSLLLSEFEIKFVPQKAIKGQALADFLAAHPTPDNMELPDDLPDEEVFTTEALTWQLYFDGAARGKGAGAGLVFITPFGGLIPYSFSLLALCSNNVAEYEALIIGLEIALEMHIDCLQAYGDSQLVVRQLSGQYAVRNATLVPYHERAKYLMSQFQDIHVSHIPRSENDKADALANLAASLTLPDERDIQITVGERHLLPPAIERIEEVVDSNVITASEHEEEQEDLDWHHPIIEYLQHGKLPNDSRKKAEVRRRAIRFLYLNDTLYKRSFDGMLLRCLSKQDATKALHDTHAGTCGAHQAGPKLSNQLKRLGYYWPTMVRDSMKFAAACRDCQLHGDFIHQPPQQLHPTTLSWPFEAWGLDVIGMIKPKSSRQHQYILAATDYFSKWAEAIPLKEVRADDVTNFIRNHIIYRYGVPSKIISDNALYFKCKSMTKLCEKYKFQHSFSASYNPSSNGQAEAFNKVLCNILKKMVSGNKRDWHERLPEALWAYRTTIRNSTGCTPYNLVFGSEAVLPLEVQLPSLRVALQLTNPDENANVRLAELEALDEKRLAAQQRLEIYQAQVAGAFNRKVKFRSFSIGDLVLTVRRPFVITRKMHGKFEPKWEGPYVITKVFSKGAYELSNAEGKCVYPCVNGKFVKKFYA